MRFPASITPSLLTIGTKRAIGVVAAVAFSCLFSATASFSTPSSALVPGGFYEDTAAGGTGGDFVCPHGVNPHGPVPSSCVVTGVHLTADATGTYFLPWSFEANISCPKHRISQAWQSVRKPYAPSDRIKVSSTGTIHRIDRGARGFRFEVKAALHNGGRLLKGWFSIHGPASGGGICTTGRVKFIAVA